MDRMTLREAAERTSRSITTLRRYIRSGRLHAEKRYGRFGPEYYVSTQDLTEAGLEPDAARRATALAERTRGGAVAPSPAAQPPARPAPETVPLTLYQELQMKHEQLLVQYGMVRAGGLRVLELQAELDKRQRKLEESKAEVSRLREQLRRGTAELHRELETARHRLEGRNLEVAALQEKVKALEMLTRNAVTNETIEKQFRQVMDQTRRVEHLQTRRRWSPNERAAWSRGEKPEPPDH